MSSKLQYHLTGSSNKFTHVKFHLCGMTDSARLPFYLPVRDACTAYL